MYIYVDSMFISMYIYIQYMYNKYIIKICQILLKGGFKFYWW